MSYLVCQRPFETICFLDYIVYRSNVPFHIPDKSPPPLCPLPQHLDLLARPSHSLWVWTVLFSSLCHGCLGWQRWSASSDWPWASRARPGLIVWWGWCGPGQGWHLAYLWAKRERGPWISAAWIFSTLCRCFPVMTTSDLWLHSCYDFKRLVRLGEYQGLKNENDGAKEDIMKHFTTCNVVEIFYFTSAAV